jgi:hypothetical protein
MVQGIYSIADMDSLLSEEKEVLDKCNQKQQSSEKEWIMIDSFEEQLEIINDRKENMINTIVNTK